MIYRKLKINSQSKYVLYINGRVMNFNAITESAEI